MTSLRTHASRVAGNQLARVLLVGVFAIVGWTALAFLANGAAQATENGSRQLSTLTGEATAENPLVKAAPVKAAGRSTDAPHARPLAVFAEKAEAKAPRMAGSEHMNRLPEPTFDPSPRGHEGLRDLVRDDLTDGDLRDCDLCDLAAATERLVTAPTDGDASRPAPSADHLTSAARGDLGSFGVAHSRTTEGDANRDRGHGRHGAVRGHKTSDSNRGLLPGAADKLARPDSLPTTSAAPTAPAAPALGTALGLPSATGSTVVTRTNTARGNLGVAYEPSCSPD